MSGDTAALLADLRNMADQARPVQDKPLRAAVEHLGGYIETVALDDGGRVWVMGWSRRKLPTESPVVIADRQRHAGALVSFSFPREDVPQDSHAFIGVIASGWRPSTVSHDVYCFLAPELTFYLRGLKPLQVVDAKVIGDHIAQALPKASGPRVQPLRALHLNAGEWTPHSPRAGFALKASVDRILVMPGFGAFAEGWLLSPSKPVTSFSLRLGSKVLRGVPGSLVRRARPDVASVGGHTPLLLDSAGFTVALEGPLRSEDLVDPILKAHFADGSSANIAIDPEVVRRIGHAVPLDDVLLCYPGLADEAFFPSFAAALQHDLESSLAQVEILAVPAQARQCVLAAMPAHPSDARLLIDDLALALRRLAAPPAVLLFADGGTSRAELPVLARIVSDATHRPCGIALVQQADKPLWALPELLNLSGSERFLLLAQHAFPCRVGWDAALEALEHEDQSAKALRQTGRGGLAALVWNRTGLLAWLGENHPGVGEAHADALLTMAAPLSGSAIAAVHRRSDARVLAAVDHLYGGRAR
jgi:hypothetical protein